MSKYVFEINPLSVSNLTTGKKVYLTWKASTWEKGKSDYSLVDLSGTAIFGNPFTFKETMHEEKGGVDSWKSRVIRFRLVEKLDGNFLTKRDRVVAKGCFDMAEYVNAENKKLCLEMTREKLKAADTALGFGIDPVLNLKITSTIASKDNDKKNKRKDRRHKKANVKEGGGGGVEEEEVPRSVAATQN